MAGQEDSLIVPVAVLLVIVFWFYAIPSDEFLIGLVKF